MRLSTLLETGLPGPACSEAVEWAGRRRVSRAAYHACERGDWLLWFAARVGVDRRLVVLAACDCAEPALAHVPAGEDRPRLAIETARAWCVGTATLGEVRAATATAYAADAADAAYARTDNANPSHWPAAVCDMCEITFSDTGHDPVFVDGAYGKFLKLCDDCRTGY